MRRSKELLNSAPPRAAWSALHWLVLPVFLFGLLLVSASAAKAHTLAHSMGEATHAISVSHLDIGSNADCCSGHEQDQAATACAVVSPCVVCAVADPESGLVQPFSIELTVAKIVVLPTGRNSMPATQSPRMLLQV